MYNAFTRSKLFVHVLKLTHKSNIKILFIVFNQLGSLTYLKGKSIVICNTPTLFSTLYIIIIIIIIIIMLSISLIIIINILPLSSYYYIRITHIYIVLSSSVSSTLSSTSLSSSSSSVGKSMHGGGPMCLVTTYSFTEGFSHLNEELLYSLFTSWRPHFIPAKFKQRKKNIYDFITGLSSFIQDKPTPWNH